MISARSRCVFLLGLSLSIIQFSDAQAQRKPYPRLSLDLGFGYALFSPDELNNFLAESGGGKIENGLAFRGGLRVQVSPHFDFNFKIGHISNSSETEFVELDSNFVPIGIIKDEYSVRSIPVSIGVGGRIPLNQLKLRAEFNIENHIARVQYKIPDIAEFEATAKSNGIGFSFAAGPEWRPTALLALNAKVGYRTAKISDFLSTSEVMFLPTEFEVDFSGVFFEAGVQIHP